jgi:hypothetical protein
MEEEAGAIGVVGIRRTEEVGGNADGCFDGVMRLAGIFAVDVEPMCCVVCWPPVAILESRCTPRTLERGRRGWVSRRCRFCRSSSRRFEPRQVSICSGGLHSRRSALIGARLSLFSSLSLARSMDLRCRIFASATLRPLHPSHSDPISCPPHRDRPFRASSTSSLRRRQTKEKGGALGCAGSARGCLPRGRVGPSSLSRMRRRRGHPRPESRELATTGRRRRAVHATSVTKRPSLDRTSPLPCAGRSSGPSSREPPEWEISVIQH